MWLTVAPDPVPPSPKLHAYETIEPSGSEEADALKPTEEPAIGEDGAKVNDAVGGWFGPVGGWRARRPLPYTFELPMGIVCVSRWARSAGSLRPGFWSNSSAAAPATCGAAPDVPENAVYGAVPVAALSGAAKSGFVRPSLDGPCELYGSCGPVVYVAWSIAATVTTCPALAGARIELDATAGVTLWLRLNSSSDRKPLPWIRTVYDPLIGAATVIDSVGSSVPVWYFVDEAIKLVVGSYR